MERKLTELSKTNFTFLSCPFLKSTQELFIQLIYMIYVFVGRPIEAPKGHPKTWEAYFIKWTTSGEPPVSSRCHQCSYFLSNKQ